MDGKQLPDKHTQKKVKYKGTEQFINAQTGEVLDLQVSSIEERDFNFSKVWMKNFISTLDAISNKKMKVALFIIENLNRDNMLLMTYQKICSKTGISYKTVADTIDMLIDAGFLKRESNGLYIVNPDIYFKGTRSNRLNVLNVYHGAGDEPKEPTKEERIAYLEKSIQMLQNELHNLTKEKVIDAQMEGQLEMDANGNIIERAH